MPDARSIRRAVTVAASILMTCAAAGIAESAPLPTPAIAPADAGASWLTPHVAAGGRWTGTILVTNTAPVARSLRLYAVDAVSLDGGAFAPGPEGERSRAGRWLTPGVGRLSLKPGQTRRVRVAVRVPYGARPGVHPAAFVAQDADRPGVSGGVRVVSRAGLRVYVTVAARHAQPPRSAGISTGGLAGAVGGLMIAVTLTGVAARR
jgi:hypothetical protein